MSEENRDSSTGQFTSAEPPYGLASIEQEAGYVHLPEEPKEEAEGLTVDEAAERYNSRTAEADVKTYTPLDLPDNVALTVEQAAKLRADRDAKDAKANEEAEDAKFRDEVDELRGNKAEEKEAVVKEADSAPVKEGDLDPEIEKALSNPKIQAALSQHVAETEAVRQQYTAAVDGAAEIAIAAFCGQFPEFQHIPAENMGAAIQAMQQQDPARAAQVAAHIQRTLGLFEQRSALHKQAEADKQARFHDYAKTEDAKFNALVKGEPAETMKAVPKLIKEALEEYGVDPAEFGRLGMQSEFLRSAAAQRLLVDAAKYRAMKNAPKAAAIRPDIPKVVKPGVTRPNGARANEAISALGGKLSQSGSVEDAYKLYQAKRKVRG
ncbi:hypothetical protein [Bradyrhizobium lablabi]|uniref:hypothetical protein n=1 Tax=Bradyrhizobium lablabi TaxID=722472 RepID=UPI000909A43D|nr:hypothetical protein [Bradyrhizobium lablabi]SHM40962.1 hypothetical protein SAMN05444321_6248 [Bradyrhizobium lablabi]